MKQAAWERGLHKPASEGKMHGKKIDIDDDAEEDPTLSLPHVLSTCWDFAHEKSALQELVERRGHILIYGVKGHPEVAGCGIEYSWGKSKQAFRRDTNDRKPKNLRMNIIKSISKKYLPITRVRKFARRARMYRRAYRDGGSSHVDVERLYKTYKRHRSAEIFDKKFCHADD